MPLKRRRSSASSANPPAKRKRILNPNDHLSPLSSELLIRILHHLPIETLLICQTLSHRFYTLTSDSQIWKSLYYSRFVLPRALRIPGVKSNAPADAIHFSSRRSKWLDEDMLVNRRDGGKTNWKGQYKLRHNWSRGSCDVQEIKVKERPSIPGMLVKLAEGVVITVEKEDGLRAWDLKKRDLVAACYLSGDAPTCVAVDEGDVEKNELGIAIGFEDGGWGSWKLDIGNKIFQQVYRHPKSSNGLLNAIAFANPYVLTITDSQLLSLYTFAPATKTKDLPEEKDLQEDSSESTHTNIKPKTIINPEQSPSKREPYLLASLKSHTCWPPLSLSIRPTPSTIIASIAYSLPTYLSGYTIGLQELHITPSSGLITSSRLTSGLPQGFNPFSPTSLSPFKKPAILTPPTSLSYSHPYILATHPDNTLSLYLCTSTNDKLELTQGTKLWGHTSSVESAEITSRGKAVSVSTRGNELRVWSLEGGFSGSRRGGLRERSIQIRKAGKDGEGEETGGMEWGESGMTRRHWVGFDDEVVIVLKEDAGGEQALVVYDFT